MRSSRVLARVCLAAALSAGVLAPASARAQQVALDRFEPAPAGDRMFGVESPYALGSGVTHVAVLFDYAHNPYTLKHGPGQSDVQAVVSDQMFVHFDASVAILDRVNLNFSVPAAVLQDGGDPTVGGATVGSPHDAAFGDMRFGVRVRAFGEWDAPFQVGVSGYLWVPTGADGLYVSDGQVRGAANVILGGHVPILNWSLSGGFQFRRTQTIQPDPSLAPFTQGTNMQIGGGVGFLFADGKAQIGPEVKGSFLTAGSNGRNLNAELTLGARYRLFDDFEIGLGAGPGLTSGFGTPDLRVIGMLAFSPQMKKPEPPDRDHDGVPDAEDACPDVPAPRTANPQKPGCPAPPDRDGDGIPDEVDACPDVPGVASADPIRNGCPPDRDGDGIPDAKDACPDQPGPPAADPARNGCPLPRDADGDGIPDAEDACPTIPGIRSADPRQNGCPGDRDGDGIRDDLDACPDVPGVPSRDPRKNGCPRAKVTAEGIEILEQVEFEVGTAKIQAVSQALITEVAGILKQHADITRIEVQGHTDNDGNRIANRVLSQQRADAVKKALVALGVDQKRLVPKGYGPDQPLVDNTTAENRAKNRRVQFVILEHAAAAAPNGGLTPPKAQKLPAPPAPKKK
jgi:OmpA-OmpF porin, OOP family